MDQQKAHTYYSADCFNKTWSLLDLEGRTPQQEREMLALTHASLYHWLQRDDCTPENLSIGLWQVARVYAVLESPQEALRYANDCLTTTLSSELSPFCTAYAHEAVCRASILADDKAAATESLNAAKQAADQVTDEHDKKLIDTDLTELSRMLEK